MAFSRVGALGTANGFPCMAAWEMWCLQGMLYVWVRGASDVYSYTRRNCWIILKGLEGLVVMQQRSGSYADL